jgi:RND family efflux transporter MFP subunit
VRAAPVRPETGYVEPRRFAGRLEPGRSAALGFERAGRVAQVLVDEGDAVAAGDVLARLDTAILENERARLAATRDAQAAVVELARVTDARQLGLTDAAVSGQRRDEARLELVRARAELAATDAALAGIAIDLEKSVLRAPFAGHVAARRLDEGATVAAGEPALELLETGAPQARVGLAPDVAADLRVGDAYQIAHRDRTHAARLVTLRPDLDPASRTVVALFDLDPHPDLAFGDVVEFVAEARRDQPGYWLPMTALTEGERGLWSVLVLHEGPDGPRVGREAVRVVAVEGERVYVAGSIEPGAAVVLDGAHRVIPGQTVQRLAQAE